MEPWNLDFIASLILIGFLPGWLWFRLPVGNRAARMALAAEERAFWCVVLSIIQSSMLVLALAVLQRYRFTTLLALDAGIAVAVVLAAGRRLRTVERPPRPGWGAVPPVLVVACCAWFYLPPSEYVMGGKDPGTYMNEGIQIAQRGGLVVADPVVSTLPAGFRDLFFPQHPSANYYGIRYMGFFILRPAEGTVVGQFPHLFPAWVAIGYGLNGLTGARQAVVWWAALGVVAVYLVGARFTARLPAALAAMLLGLNVIHFWFARYPNAEMPMLALVFAAVLAYARAAVDGDRFFGPIAASLLGLLLFLKPIDAAVVWAAVALAAVLLYWHDGRRPALGFVLPLAIWGCAGAAYLVLLLAPYAHYPIEFVRNLTLIEWTLIVGASAGAAGLLLGLRRWTPRGSDHLPTLLGAAVVGLAGYAYFVRQAGGRTAEHDAMALRSFAWYVSPLGLAGAVAGYIWATRRWFWRDPFLCTLVPLCGAVFFYKIRIVPEHFWMTRRFLPVILPGALLFLASLVCLRGAGDGSARPGLLAWLRTAAALVVVALVAAGFVRQSRAIATHVEYAGLIPRLEALAQRFGERDLVVVESRNSSDLHVLALPLTYIYARPTLVLASPRPDRLAFKEFLAWARGSYEHVYFIGGGGTDVLTRSMSVRPVASERFQVPEYESVRNAYPTAVRHKEFDFGVYEFVPGDEPHTTRTLDVGTMDDLHVVRFHAKERDASSGIDYRWSRDTSYVTLVGLTAEVRTLTLWLNDGRRPLGAAPAVVEVWLDDHHLGRATVGPGFTPYAFAIPAEVAEAAAARDEPARLRLGSSVWTPRAVLGTPDDRDLGVMLDKLEIR